MKKYANQINKPRKTISTRKEPQISLFELTDDDVLDEKLDNELKEAVVEVRKISVALAVTAFFELTL